MKFTIEKEVFLKGLARIQGVADKRNTMPVLSNLLIETKDGVIQIAATDLEIGIRSTYPATIVAPGRITAPAKKLHEIIKELADQEVSFEVQENNRIELRCGKACFHINGLSTDEFPVLKEVPEEEGLKLPSKMMKEMIEKTAVAMSNDESKYNLNGLFIKASESVLRLVATDGHRLTMIDHPLNGEFVEQLQKGVILPRKGVLELKKLAEEGDDDLALMFQDNNAVAVKDNTIIHMRLCDGDFPDYERVLPQNNDQEALVPSEAMIRSLRRMLVFATEKTRGVSLQFKTGLLELTSSNPDLGNAREEIEMAYQGPDMTIGFNARYLLDILQVQDTPNIKVLFKDDRSPGLFAPEQADGYQAVIMPMRL